MSDEDKTLRSALTREPERFDFFQAVRLLTNFAWRDEDGAKPIGEDAAPGEEVVRFRALASHSFPSGTISELTTEPDGPPSLSVSFMGLTGPCGVLPSHYTQLMIDRVRHKDYALKDFFDLFNHRVISLFYRVWAKYRFAIGYEQSRLREKGEDLFTHCLFSLVGMGTRGLRGRLAIDDECQLYFGGHFAHFPRTAQSLERMVMDYFSMPVTIEQFQGQWLYLNRDDQTCMPGQSEFRGQNNALGMTAVVGERVWGVENRFRLRIGPLGYDDFCRCDPTGDLLLPIAQLVRTYAGPDFDFDIQPVLRAREIPLCRLGAGGPVPSRLGWNTWIRAADAKKDADDAVFQSEGLPSSVGGMRT